MNNNKPQDCRQILNDIRMMVVGPKPASENPDDHKITYSTYGLQNEIGASDQWPWALLLALKLNQIKSWRETSHTYLNGYSLPYGLDPNRATNYAMNFFGPVIKDLIFIASIFIDISLMVDDKDPQWII